MKISTKGRYALRMMLDLAYHQDEGYIALKDIARRQNISKKYLEQIVSLMRGPQSTRAKRMLLKAASFIDLHSSSMKPSFVDKSCAYCG